MMLLSVFSRRRMNGARRPAQALGRVLIAPALDRRRIAALERRGRAEQPRVEEVHDRVQLSQPVLDRRPGQRHAVARGQRPDRLRLLGVDRLDVLRFIERDPLPLDPGERLAVARRQRVGRDHEVRAPRGGRELAAFQPLGAVMDEHAQPRREPLGLALPVADDRHRADQQRGREALGARPVLGWTLLALGEQQCQRLTCLPQSHVVRQARPQPERSRGTTATPTRAADTGAARR